MPWTGGGTSPIIKGAVNTFAELPNVVASEGQLWFVKNPDRAFFPKYPRGVYYSDGSTWELTPIKVKWSEDAGSIVNWTTWSDWYNGSEDIEIGDRLLFNNLAYTNTTGTQTTTSPHQDGLNWDLSDANIIRYYNDTGFDIEPFKVLHLKSAVNIGGKLHVTPDLADASQWELTQGTLSVSCELIKDGEFGCSVKNITKLTGGDTSGTPAGSQLWLSADGTGSLTHIKPEFPDYSISMGGNYNQAAAPNGQIIVSVTTDIYDTFNDGWDGAIRETFDFRVTSDGATILGTLTNQAFPSNDLTMLFSSGFDTLDVTTVPKTLALIPGTASVIQLNYVFIDKATLTLQTSTTEFPTTEHAKIAVVGVFDETITMNDGAIRNQNINDHIKKEDDNGHIMHIAERLRALNAEWDSGILSTLAGTPTNMYISITAGKVWQVHKQDIPAQNMATGDEIHVVNDSVTPYRNTTNLNDITDYSTGLTWNNQWSNIVVWGVANKTGEPDHLMVNLPSDGYNTEDVAIEDRNNFTNYQIPTEFKGVGFLIGRYTVRPSGGAFTYNAGVGYLDLRGTIPNNVAGGSSGSSGVFTAPQYTTTQRDALSPVNGWIIYNTSTNIFEFYENGAWVAK
jgi:hypothetical protein